MPFRSHCGTFFFLLPCFPGLVIRNLLLALHAQLVDKNFVFKELTTCKLLSRKVLHFSFCLAMALYILRTSFRLKRSCMFHSTLRWPCIYVPCATVWARPCDVSLKFKPVPHFLVYSFLVFWLFPYGLVA